MEEAIRLLKKWYHEERSNRFSLLYDSKFMKGFEYSINLLEKESKK